MAENRVSARAPRPGLLWRRRAVVGVTVVVAAVVLATVGRRGAARVAREIAFGHMNACEFRVVRRWLGWCALLDPSDYHVDLLRAACYRQFGQFAAWQETLAEAARKNAPPGAIAAQRKLDRIRRGELSRDAEAEIGDLMEAGASQTDVAEAFLSGYIAQDDAESARLFLERMSPYFADNAQEDYLWGIYLFEQKDFAGAQVRLARVLERQPGHELARAELGAVLEEKDDLEGALGQFAELVSRSDGSILARIGLARVLRSMGRVDEARSALGPLDSEREAGADFQLEMARIALEAGDYEDALRRFRAMPAEHISEGALKEAALALTFAQEPQAAQRVFAKGQALGDLDKWRTERRLRLTTDPRDLAAAEERARLTGPGISTPGDSKETTTELPGLDPADRAGRRSPDLADWPTEGLRPDGRPSVASVRGQETRAQRTETRAQRTETDPADRAGRRSPDLADWPTEGLRPDGRPSVASVRGQETRAQRKSPAEELFRVHCGKCHGLRGDGRGPAAHRMFPRPRDLRAGMCQLVSTVNGVPTREDVEQILARGMPGTSMQSFEELLPSDRRLLAEEVLRLRREGIREQIAAALRREGEEIEESEVRQAVQRATTPGKQVLLPAQWPDAGQGLLRGKTSFAALGCVKCHGEAGTGAADHDLFDDLGQPSRPRDLVHEPLKGGREPEAIYRRIVAGMPGTAHPAALNLPQEQVIELVDYVRSLAHEPPRMLTNHQRRVLATIPAYLDWLEQGPVAGR